MSSTEFHLSASSRTVPKQIAYIFTILLIFILPWRALLTLTDGITAARAFGALAGLFWIVYLVIHGKMRRLDPFHVVLFLFVVWIGLSAIWTVDTTATLFTFFSIFSGAVFCVVLWDLFRTETDIATAAFAYIAGCYIVILVEGFDFLFLGHFRIGDTISGPNYVVARLIFGLPLAWYLTVHQSPYNRQKIQYIAAAYLPIASVAILFTRSRQGFVALAIAIALILVAYSSSKKRLQLSIGGTIAVVISTLLVAYYALGDRFQDALPIGRLEQAISVLTGDLSAADAGLGVRFEIYSAGIEVFRSNFVHGTGAGSFSTAVEPLTGRPYNPHSTYLAIGVENGIIGLSLFALMILFLMRGLSDFTSPKKMMGISLLVLYLVVSLVNTWIFDFTTLFVLTIILLTSRPVLNIERSLHE